MPKLCKPEYLERVKHLSEEDAERLLSRMAGKLPKRLAKEKINQPEALALQMELEDEHLQEWRKIRLAVREREEDEKRKDAEKAAAKTRVAEKNKTVSQSRVPTKAKVAGKSKPAEKTKVVGKPKTA